MTDPDYCSHEVDDLTTIQGGTRQYVEGLLCFLSVTDDEGTVATISSLDRSGLAAAIRRAADQIEGVAPSPFKLPPVTITGAEFLRQTEGA